MHSDTQNILKTKLIRFSEILVIWDKTGKEKSNLISKFLFWGPGKIKLLSSDRKE